MSKHTVASPREVWAFNEDDFMVEVIKVDCRKSYIEVRGYEDGQRRNRWIFNLDDFYRDYYYVADA